DAHHHRNTSAHGQTAECRSGTHAIFRPGFSPVRQRGVPQERVDDSCRRMRRHLQNHLAVLRSLHARPMSRIIVSWWCAGIGRWPPPDPLDAHPKSGTGARVTDAGGVIWVEPVAAGRLVLVDTGVDAGIAARGLGDALCSSSSAGRSFQSRISNTGTARLPCLVFSLMNSVSRTTGT